LFLNKAHPFFLSNEKDRKNNYEDFSDKEIFRFYKENVATSLILLRIKLLSLLNKTFNRTGYHRLILSLCVFPSLILTFFNEAKLFVCRCKPQLMDNTCTAFLMKKSTSYLTVSDVSNPVFYI